MLISFSVIKFRCIFSGLKFNSSKCWVISVKQSWSDKTIIRSLRFKTVTQEQLKDWTWILFLWLNPPKYFLVMLLWRPKRSLLTFKRTIYQMDHIWGARSGLKKSLALLFLKKSAIILRQDFLKTLYTKYIKIRPYFCYLTRHSA